MNKDKRLPLTGNIEHVSELHTNSIAINNKIAELRELLIIKYGTEYKETYKGYEHLLTHTSNGVTVSLDSDIRS